jgi:drug/metabolite transporter (DMT)-like permease
MPFVGQLAALTTSLCWASNSVSFTLAGRRVGAQTVNFSRLWVAFLTMLLLNLVFFGAPLPLHAGGPTWFWLALSGLVGFALGDALLFEAFLRLGPRLAMLIVTVWPVFTTLMAWAWFDERLGATRLLAIGVTLAGLAWVVSGGHPDEDGKPHPHLVTGVLLALGGALGQAVGIILSKKGLQGGLHPVQANMIRVLAGTLTVTVSALVRGEGMTYLRRLRDLRALGHITAGGLTGPVLGVILSLVAITHIHAGVASTLMSLPPVILLPVSAWIFHERITARSLLGTLITLAGVAGLFFL